MAYPLSVRFQVPSPAASTPFALSPARLNLAIAAMDPRASPSNCSLDRMVYRGPFGVMPSPLRAQPKAIRPPLYFQIY